MTVEESIAISFIIPAFNEEKSIGETLSSISHGEIKLPYEIIVVDHDSQDKTAEIASAQGAKLISVKGGTIAGVRNTGVKGSKGKLIVFLDADVSLTEKWFEAFEQVAEQLSHHPMMVTGSHCNPPEQGSWIESYWFKNLTHEVRITHLGTGHMIVTRELFDAINGFDELLETGEDYSFCMRAVGIGAKVINNPDLYVIHRDYPKNILAFIRREAWHGMGDVQSIQALLGSKVAIASMIFIILHLLVLLAMFLSIKSAAVMGVLLAGLGGLLVFSSWLKFNHCNLTVIAVNSAIFYLYFVGRSLSLFRMIFIKLVG